jgi:O-antigen/teichoic acid export membrane protein
MHTSIKAKTITGLFWAFHERCGQQGIQLAVTVVLGRLLLPEQFGLVGMLLFFIAIAESLVDSGFGLALIQKQDSNHVDECSVFYFNIVVGCVIGGLLWLGAPAIAAFYNQPMLMPIARVLSINPVISAFGLVQTVLLVKSIDFKTLLKASVTATLVSALLSIVLARVWRVELRGALPLQQSVPHYSAVASH